MAVHTCSCKYMCTALVLHLTSPHCPTFTQSPANNYCEYVVFLHCVGVNIHTHTRQVVPGELTIVTGVPNSGKSEWIDALLVNLAFHHGWAFALCSMEKKVRDHARQLLEKTMRKPFFDAPYANNTPRMSWAEVRSCGIKKT